MVTLLVGTDKGAWALEGGGGAWQAGEQLFPGWEVFALGRAPDGTFLAGVGSGWFGPAVHRSLDLRKWEQVVDGPSYASDGPKLEQIWTFTTAGDRVYAGVAEAGVFTSDDNGATWQPLSAFNDHPTRAQWQPGGGGLCAHRVLVDPNNANRLWVGVSAVGVFRSDDGGKTFAPRNVGVHIVAPEEEAPPTESPEIGYCVHGLTLDPQWPDRIWRQEHGGVYISQDGGDTWRRTEEGLPGNFGFPIAREGSTGSLFLVPLHSDMQRHPVDGRFAAYRSTDGGATWSVSGTGWPDEPTYDSVLRGAMSADDRGTVALGTTGGAVWASTDAGDTWSRVPGTFPRIRTVAVVA